MNETNNNSENEINKKTKNTITNTENAENIKNKPKNTNKIIIISLLSFNIIFILIICFLLIYFLKIKPNKEKEISNTIINNNSTQIQESLDENKNSIEAIYKAEKGKDILLFNPKELKLKEGDYSIKGEIISESETVLRNLIEIGDINGLYSPSHSGYLLINIHFNNNLKNLDNCFKDCKQLIKVNLANLETGEVESMNSTFSGCINLKDINLEGINTGNLVDMSYTFENCKELTNINLSPINGNDLMNIRSIFSGCDKLQQVNISSFESLNENMFDGIKSLPNIIGNDNIYSKITQTFYNLFSVYVNVTIIQYHNQTRRNKTQCIIGENEKCKKCSKIIPENCLICNDGYYLPFNEYENKVCLSCKDKIDHCNSCFGNKNFITCASCQKDYFLENNLCIKQKDLCIIGEKEKCKSCNDEPNLRYQCQECNQGFYLPKENKTFCQSCEIIENCADCTFQNNGDNLSCIKCKEGFELIDGKCEEEKCVIGKNEKCASCKEEKKHKKECYSCNEGYNISDNDPYICQKCSIKNCKKCSFRFGEEICLECADTFTEIKNDEGFINDCGCPNGNITNDGICIRGGNWIDIVAQNHGEIDEVLDFYRIDISSNDIDLYINGKLTPFNFQNKRIKIRFGNYERNNVTINIKKQLTSFEGLFDWCHTVLSVSFLPGFDATQVTSMRYMFYDTEIEYIDMKHLKFNSLLDMSQCFDHIPYNFRIWDKVPNTSLIDFSSINTSQVTDCLGIFHTMYDTYTIKISNKFTKCKEFIPITNKVINIDELNCNKFPHCKKCEGSAETLHCIECNLEYELINNKCVKAKCSLGLNEKCYTCNNNSSNVNHENECNSCNEGYYLPSNHTDKTKCIKCPIDGCQSCDNLGICQKCFINYKTKVINGKINSCSLKCDLGNNEKCLECGEENKCSICNNGYKLMKNGSCKKIENSFIAKYRVNSTSEPVRIMNIDSNNIQLSDFDMYLNSIKIYPSVEYYWYPIEGYYIIYSFNKTGSQEIKIIFKKNLSIMLKLFQRCYDLLSIEFNEAFDTSHVLSMNQLFYECTSLEYVNVSSFNTSLVGDYYGIFYGCSKLTSLDLSNFEGTYAFSTDGMFYYSDNLRYIDLSSFYSSSNTCPYFGLSTANMNNATIIKNKKLSSCRKDQGWNVIYKE